MMTKTKTTDNDNTMFIRRRISAVITMMGLTVLLVAIMTTLLFTGSNSDIGILQGWQQKLIRRHLRRRRLIDDNTTATPITAAPSDAPSVVTNNINVPSSNSDVGNFTNDENDNDTDDDDEGNDTDVGFSSLCPVDYTVISGTQCGNDNSDGDGDGEDGDGGENGDDNTCDYNHIYTGCTFEDLKCTPIVQCKCKTINDDNDYGIGNTINNNNNVTDTSSDDTKSDSSRVWVCEVNIANIIGNCNSIPLGLPVGEFCDRTVSLPTRIPTNEPSNSPSISISSSLIPTNSPTDNPTTFRPSSSSPPQKQQQTASPTTPIPPTTTAQQQKQTTSPTTLIPPATTAQQQQQQQPPPPQQANIIPSIMSPTFQPTFNPTFQPTLNPTMKPTGFTPPPFQRGSTSNNRLGPRLPSASTTDSSTSTSTSLSNNAGSNNNNNNVQYINSSLRRRPSINTNSRLSSTTTTKTTNNNNIFSSFYSF
jgi:hypothetical protein